MATRTFEVEGSDGRVVRATAHGDPSAPHVLVAHGFKGFRSWGSWPYVCEQIAAAGYCAVRFDYSHNGVEETDFDRLDLFMLDTWTRHQEDLTALAAVTPAPFALLGHSRGGGDVLLFAAQDPRAACVITWASVSSARAGPEGYEEALRSKGFVTILNGRTGQAMPIGRHAFEDAAAQDLLGSAAKVTCPVLLTHGDADDAVPMTAMQRLAAVLPQANTREIAGANHVFGARHPFAGTTPQLDEVLAATTAFLREHLPPNA